MCQKQSVCPFIAGAWKTDQKHDSIQGSGKQHTFCFIFSHSTKHNSTDSSDVFPEQADTQCWSTYSFHRQHLLYSFLIQRWWHTAKKNVGTNLPSITVKAFKSQLLLLQLRQTTVSVIIQIPPNMIGRKNMTLASGSHVSILYLKVRLKKHLLSQCYAKLCKQHAAKSQEKTAKSIVSPGQVLSEHFTQRGWDVQRNAFKQ